MIKLKKNTIIFIGLISNSFFLLVILGSFFRIFSSSFSPSLARFFSTAWTTAGYTVFDVLLSQYPILILTCILSLFIWFRALRDQEIGKKALRLAVSLIITPLTYLIIAVVLYFEIFSYKQGMPYIQVLSTLSFLISCICLILIALKGRLKYILIIIFIGLFSFWLTAGKFYEWDSYSIEYTGPQYPKKTYIPG